MSRFTRHGYLWFYTNAEGMQASVPCDDDGWISVDDLMPVCFGGMLISLRSWDRVETGTELHNASDPYIKDLIQGWQPKPTPMSAKP